MQIERKWSSARTFKQAFGVFSVELEKFTSRTTNFGEDEGDAPDFGLVPQAVFTRELPIQFPLRAHIRHMIIGTRTLSSASRRADSKGRRGTL